MYSRNYRIFAGKTLIEEGQHDVDWDTIRHRRDSALKDSDWRALKDRVLPNEWKEYRQALRDITAHPDANTAADNWPVMPDE